MNISSTRRTLRMDALIAEATRRFTLYAESFRGQHHLAQIQGQAQELVRNATGKGRGSIRRRREQLEVHQPPVGHLERRCPRPIGSGPELVVASPGRHAVEATESGIVGSDPESS